MDGDAYQEAFEAVLANEPLAWEAERIRIKRRKYCHKGPIAGRITILPSGVTKIDYEWDEWDE